jgi:hypothetical protein
MAWTRLLGVAVPVVHDATVENSRGESPRSAHDKFCTEVNAFRGDVKVPERRGSVERKSDAQADGRKVGTPLPRRRRRFLPMRVGPLEGPYSAAPRVHKRDFDKVFTTPKKKAIRAIGVKLGSWIR